MSDVTKDRSGIARRLGGFLGTAAIIALAGGLAVGGAMVISERAEAVPQADPVPPVPVTAITPDWRQGYSVERRFIGQAEALQTTDLGFETGGTLLELLVDEGDVVAGGAVIARLDTRVLEARRDQLEATRAALEARASLAEATAERQVALEERGFASGQRLDEVRFSLIEIKAGIAEIDAGLSEVDVQLDKSELRAPFNAVVSVRLADTGQRVGAGQPLVQLLENAKPQVRVGVPSVLADTLERGTQATIRTDGRALKASVARVLPDIDPRTRTRDVLLRADDGAEMVFGAVVDVAFARDVDTQGVWLPATALSAGPNGSWRVFVLEDAEVPQVVEVEAVEILHSDNQRVFVRGALPGSGRIVTDGVHRLVPGQTVQLASGDL